MIAAILAISDNSVIGSENDLPWPHIAEDMKRFVELTNNNIVVMGRKTWDSLPTKPLKNRTNFVVTSKNLKEVMGASGTLHGADIATAAKNLATSSNKDMFIIGGGEVYQQLFSICDKIYITRIPGEFEGKITLNIDDYIQGYTLTKSTKGTVVIFEEWEKT